MKRNGRLAFVAKAIRTFCYGSLGVLFPIYLTQLGVDAKGLGLALTLTLLSSALMTYGVRRPSQKYGPRAVLVLLAALTILSALLFLFFSNPWVIVLAAALGNFAVGSGETGPFLSMDQVVLAKDTARHQLTGVMSSYNLVGYAASALGAALVGSASVPVHLLFSIFLVAGILQIGLYALMQSETIPRESVSHPKDMPSLPILRKLAVLFGLDAFAGGFVLQSIVLYWFHVRFGLALGPLGWISFGTQLCTGISLLLAPWLAKRFGLVRTMIFSHLVSNVLLIAVAFAPVVWLAVVLLLSRHLLSQIDVPTRQSFLMHVVQDHEREHAATVTNMSRTLAQAISPSLTGWVMQAIALSAPFALGGGLKIGYDLMLYAAVKHLDVRSG